MSLGDYQILHPWFALLFLGLPLVGWFGWKRVRRGTLRFSSIAPFRRIRPSARIRLRFVLPVLRTLAAAAIILALCRPQKGIEKTPERSRGIGILMVVDSSESMLQDDFEIDRQRVTRVEAVKRVARDFIRGGNGLPGRPNDEIGLISFSGYPVPRAPLTLDHGAVLEVLDSVEPVNSRELSREEKDRYGRPLYPEEFQTAIGDSLALAANQLRDADVKSKVMILLSDGRQTMGELKPEEGARIAAAFGIRVYTIGIGQSGTVLVSVPDGFGGVMRVPRRSDLDEATLQDIAETTGGQYFNAATTGALRNVYAEIDQLERSEIQKMRFSRWDEKFQPLALAGLALLVLEILLSQTVFRRIP